MGEGIAYHAARRSILATGSDDFNAARSSVTQGTNMIPFRPSRREMLRASVIGGIAVHLAPLGSGAFAALFEEQLLTRPDWNSRDGTLKYRIDATSKVTGEK